MPKFQKYVAQFSGKSFSAGKFSFQSVIAKKEKLNVKINRFYESICREYTSCNRIPVRCILWTNSCDVVFMPSVAKSVHFPISYHCGIHVAYGVQIGRYINLHLVEIRLLQWGGGVSKEVMADIFSISLTKNLAKYFLIQI